MQRPAPREFLIPTTRTRGQGFQADLRRWQDWEPGGLPIFVGSVRGYVRESPSGTTPQGFVVPATSVEFRHGALIYAARSLAALQADRTCSKENGLPSIPVDSVFTGLDALPAPPDYGWLPSGPDASFSALVVGDPFAVAVSPAVDADGRLSSDLPWALIVRHDVSAHDLLDATFRISATLDVVLSRTPKIRALPPAPDEEASAA
jgi:hypothetical protein